MDESAEDEEPRETDIKDQRKLRRTSSTATHQSLLANAASAASTRIDRTNGGHSFPHTGPKTDAPLKPAFSTCGASVFCSTSYAPFAQGGAHSTSTARHPIISGQVQPDRFIRIYRPHGAFDAPPESRRSGGCNAPHRFGITGETARTDACPTSAPRRGMRIAGKTAGRLFL